MGDAVIRDCANYGSYTYNGNLTTGTNFGGLLGNWSNGKLTMENCVNYGSVITTNSADTRSAVGAPWIVISRRDRIGLENGWMDCDSYRFLEGDIQAINAFRGEYMKQYSWAEGTLGRLTFRAGR